MQSLGSSDFDEETTTRCLGNKKKTRLSGTAFLLMVERPWFMTPHDTCANPGHIHIEADHFNLHNTSSSQDLPPRGSKERKMESIHPWLCAFSSQGSFGWDLEVTGGTQSLKQNSPCRFLLSLCVFFSVTRSVLCSGLCVLLLWRTPVWFPVFIWEGSQLPVIPIPGKPALSAGLCGYLHMCMHTHKQ